MRKSLYLLLVLLVAVTGSVKAVSKDFLDSKFKEANQYYEDKKYDEAIDVYVEIVDSGMVSASVYFNLGNAYFREGDLGRAILYYMKARKLDPSDNDIRTNLEFARQYTNIQMEGVQLNPISTFFEDIVGPYRLSTLAWISSIFFILFFIVLSIRYGLGFRNTIVRSAVLVILIFLIVTSGLTTFKYRHDFLTRRAVIVAEDCPVTTGPSEESDIELEAAPGLVVEILSQSGDYYNVLFENKRRGWIKTDLVAEI